SPPSPLFPYTTLFRSVFREQCSLQSGRVLRLQHLEHRRRDHVAEEHDAAHPQPERHQIKPFDRLRHRARRVAEITDSAIADNARSEEHTSELQSRFDL